MKKVPLKFEELKVGMKVQTDLTSDGSQTQGWVVSLQPERSQWMIEFDTTKTTIGGSREGYAIPQEYTNRAIGRFWCMCSDNKVTLIEDVKVKKPKLNNWKILEKAIIAEESKKEIIALLKQHQHKDILFEKWGLGEVIEYGKGMIMLFYGPPGTGKPTPPA